VDLSLMQWRPATLISAALAVGLLVGHYVPRPPSFAAPTSASAVGSASVAFDLVDQFGHNVTAASMRGKTLLVFFGYTYCPDICPTTLIDMRDAKSALKQDADRFRGIFISVDPSRDTPERLRDYIAHFDESLIGLSGQPQQLKAAAESFGALYERGADVSGGGYEMAHTAFGYLVKADGTIDTIFPHGTSAAEMATAIRQLLAQQANQNS
jgi:protein SCO1